MIQRSLQNQLAEKILQGAFHDGEVVEVSASRDGLILNGAVGEAAAA